MSKPLGMTYHDDFGHLPTALLRRYRKVKATPAEHNLLMALYGEDWDLILATVENYSTTGLLRLPLYL